jgi:hypothetical protein
MTPVHPTILSQVDHPASIRSEHAISSHLVPSRPGIVGSGFVELTEQERLKRKRSKLLQQRGLHSAHTVTDCSSRDTQMTSTQMEDGLELVTLQQVGMRNAPA